MARHLPSGMMFLGAAALVAVGLGFAGTLARADEGAAHAIAERFSAAAEGRDAETLKAEEQRMLDAARQEALERKAQMEREAAEREAAEERKAAEAKALDEKRIADEKKARDEKLAAETARKAAEAQKLADAETAEAEKRQALKARNEEREKRIEAKLKAIEQARLDDEAKAREQKVAREAEARAKALADAKAAEEKAAGERKIAEEKAQAEARAKALADAKAAEEKAAAERKIAADKESAERAADAKREVATEAGRAPSVPPMGLGVPTPPQASAGSGAGRYTVLLALEPGKTGIRRFGAKTADPVLCSERSCWISGGAEKAAHLVRRGEALGPGNTLGRRAAACNHQLTCVYRGVDLGSARALLQPIDLRIMRHDRRDPVVITPPKDCGRQAGPALSCATLVEGRTWKAWIVPEHVAEAAGPQALSEALARGLPANKTATPSGKGVAL